jgi:hypothetical protein
MVSLKGAMRRLFALSGFEIRHVASDIGKLADSQQEGGWAVRHTYFLPVPLQFAHFPVPPHSP